MRPHSHVYPSWGDIVCAFILCEFFRKCDDVSDGRFSFNGETLGKMIIVHATLICVTLVIKNTYRGSSCILPHSPSFSTLHQSSSNGTSIQCHLPSTPRPNGRSRVSGNSTSSLGRTSRIHRHRRRSSRSPRVLPSRWSSIRENCGTDTDNLYPV